LRRNSSSATLALSDGIEGAVRPPDHLQ